MDSYYVIGNPVAHSKSPDIHARFAALTGQTLRYERLLVEPEQFASRIQELIASGVKGCNVTVPFKLQAAALADPCSDRVKLAGAANTLSFRQGLIHADNTDGIGLVRDIEVNQGQLLQGQRVLLLGAGGAAAGALGPLLMAKPSQLVVSNRTHSKAQALIERHRRHPSLQSALSQTELLALPLDDQLPAFDLVINATAGSLAGAAPPIAAHALKPNALVYDMMYGPAAQSFLQWASALGARTRDGLGMLVEQAAESFFIWRGVRPPTAEVLAQLRQAS